MPGTVTFRVRVEDIKGRIIYKNPGGVHYVNNKTEHGAPLADYRRPYHKAVGHLSLHAFAFAVFRA